jgi:4-hydroxythreonine-4-phosphate dehydrogenase
VNTAVPRVAVTAGEPAGIGPDLIITLAQQSHDCELVVIGDRNLLESRAAQLNLPVELHAYDPQQPGRTSAAGTLSVWHTELAEAAIPGELNPANGPYVLSTLERAGNGCLSGEFAAVLTAPVQKSVICESGTAFSGHTEYFARLCAAEQPVMLLCAGELRVALLTTHLPLAEVPAQVTQDRVKTITRILHDGLVKLFAIDAPRIAVLGLNPHAGESGQLGREEIEHIAPALDTLRSEGLLVSGPLPADSAFTQQSLKEFDAVLAMYHDQGLPVLKHAGFGNAVNVTLGLPIVRTSVDHGTALQLAGTGKADASSLRAALQMAQDFSLRNQP